MNLVEQPTVFVVDDDPACRDSLALLLELKGKHTALFSSAEGAMFTSTPMRSRAMPPQSHSRIRRAVPIDTTISLISSHAVQEYSYLGT